jgi:hypothetical protein
MISWRGSTSRRSREINLKNATIEFPFFGAKMDPAVQFCIARSRTNGRLSPDDRNFVELLLYGIPGIRGRWSDTAADSRRFVTG